MKKVVIVLSVIALLFNSCKDEKNEIEIPSENYSNFSKIGDIKIGDKGAAEITAYDSDLKHLFVVNNSGNSKIDIINISDPSKPSVINSIDISSYGTGVNSVAVKNGLLAAAIEANIKQNKGKIVVFNTSDLKEVKQITVGALPDMVTFSPNGELIICANEGEPNGSYSDDPDGSISIINVTDNFSVVTLDFSKFNNQTSQLEEKGFRVFGPNADLAADVEPEYITVSDDSKTAWVTLQENNGVAKVDLSSKSITDIFPLGYKDYSLAGNEIDPSNKDDKVEFRNVNAFGMYQPDAIASYSVNGITYFVTANEGDGREYWDDANNNDEIDDDETVGYVGEKRVEKLDLDNSVFTDNSIQDEDKLGRLKVAVSQIDKNNDNLADMLVSYGARSFSIWNGSDGSLVYDSGSELGRKVHQLLPNNFDDGRSDDKGVEPEGVCIGKINNKTIAFIGLERADAVATYDVSDPSNPLFLQMLKVGYAPEGLLFIPSTESPNNKSLLVVSNENDGTVLIFQPSL